MQLEIKVRKSLFYKKSGSGGHFAIRGHSYEVTLLLEVRVMRSFAIRCQGHEVTLLLEVKVRKTYF